METHNLTIVLGNPGGANDLVAKALSLSEDAHHFKGAECDLVESVAASAKLFMDDLPTDGTISVEAAMNVLEQKQSNFYCGAGFKLEPEWTNNLFLKENGRYVPMHSIRKLCAGQYGVNTYRNRKHTPVWPKHFDNWDAAVRGVRKTITQDTVDHQGEPFNINKRFILAEYGNFHWFRQCFPQATLVFPQWRNQMHFAHYYHLRQYGHAQDTDTLSNRDTNQHNIGFADELIQRFIEITDTKLEEPLLRSILFKFPHYIPQYLMNEVRTGVDEFLRDPRELEKLVRTALRRSMYFAMRKENMMRAETERHYKIYIDDFFVDPGYRSRVFEELNLREPEMTKYLQSVQSVLVQHKPKRPDLPQEWKNMHNPEIEDQALLAAVIDVFQDYANIPVTPTTALDDIKVHAPGKKQHWTVADELVIELTLCLRGIFDDIQHTNIGAWTGIYTVAEFVHRLEQHVQTLD